MIDPTFCVKKIYFCAVQDCLYLTSHRSRRHVQTQGYPINTITNVRGPKIQCVASQQVKNLIEKTNYFSDKCQQLKTIFTTVLEPWS